MGLQSVARSAYTLVSIPFLIIKLIYKSRSILRFRVILWSVPRSGTIPQFTERLRLLSKLQYCKLQFIYLILICNISNLQYPLLQYIVCLTSLCRAYHVRMKNKVQMWLYCCTNATVQTLSMGVTSIFYFYLNFI